MQHEQQWNLLKTLGESDCSAVVLVRNNLSAPEMKHQIIEAGGKTVLFGFQGTGGNRYEDYTEVLSLHKPSMVLGGLGETIPEEIIVPIARLCYIVGCELRKCTGKQRKTLLDATSNAFEALKKTAARSDPRARTRITNPVQSAV